MFNIKFGSVLFVSLQKKKYHQDTEVSCSSSAVLWWWYNAKIVQSKVNEMFGTRELTSLPPSTFNLATIDDDFLSTKFQIYPLLLVALLGIY